MKVVVYFSDRAPVAIDGADRMTVEIAGAVYRIVPQLEALGVRLDQPLGDSLSVLPTASNGVDVINVHHEAARLTPRKRKSR